MEFTRGDVLMAMLAGGGSRGIMEFTQGDVLMAVLAGGGIVGMDGIHRGQCADGHAGWRWEYWNGWNSQRVTWCRWPCWLEVGMLGFMEFTGGDLVVVAMLAGGGNTGIHGIHRE